VQQLNNDWWTIGVLFLEAFCPSSQQLVAVSSESSLLICARVILLFFYSVLWRHDQLVRPRVDVHLLRTIGTWTSHAEVSLVEEISHPHPTGKLSRFSLSNSLCRKWNSLLIYALYASDCIRAHCVTIISYIKSNVKPKDVTPQLLLVVFYQFFVCHVSAL